MFSSDKKVTVELNQALRNNAYHLYKGDKEVNHFCDRVAEYFENFNNFPINVKVALIEDFEHQISVIRKFAPASISYTSRERLALTIEAFQKAHNTTINNNIRSVSINYD